MAPRKCIATTGPVSLRQLLWSILAFVVHRIEVPDQMTLLSRLSLALLVLGIAASPALAKRIDPILLQGEARAVDGDTLQVGDTRLRLHGIDAPELRQTCEDSDGEAWACGRRAASELAAAVAGGEIHCISRERDRYQRLVATCWSQGRDIGQSLVSHGWAVAYRRYSADYVRDEDIARYLTHGMWSGRFEMPWEWRQARRRQ
jgi:endonuclease YncB( thermonuclease family)